MPDTLSLTEELQRATDDLPSVLNEKAETSIDEQAHRFASPSD